MTDSEFGFYISGFTDGEGSFCLCEVYSIKRECSQRFITFKLEIRADDVEILRRIQDFWGCGSLTYHTKKNPKHSPSAALAYTKTSDLINVIIPHFEQYPLQAKKARDFDVWKQAAYLRHSIMQRNRKWTTDESTKFTELMTDLKGGRKYNKEVGDDYDY